MPHAPLYAKSQSGTISAPPNSRPNQNPPRPTNNPANALVAISDMALDMSYGNGALSLPTSEPVELSDVATTEGYRNKVIILGRIEDLRFDPQSPMECPFQRTTFRMTWPMGKTMAVLLNEELMDKGPVQRWFVVTPANRGFRVINVAIDQPWEPEKPTDLPPTLTTDAFGLGPAKASVRILNREIMKRPKPIQWWALAVVRLEGGVV